jgi:hypothetical protein
MCSKQSVEVSQFLYLEKDLFLHENQQFYHLKWVNNSVEKKQ